MSPERSGNRRGNGRRPGWQGPPKGNDARRRGPGPRRPANGQRTDQRGRRQFDDRYDRRPEDEPRPLEHDDAPSELGRQVEGVVELHPNGFGFIRQLDTGGQVTPDDAYIPPDLIRRFALREGHQVVAELEGRASAGRPMNGNGNAPYGRDRRQMPRNDRQQGPRVRAIVSIEGKAPDDLEPVKEFDRLTPIDPTQWLKLETRKDQLTTRIIDLFTPIGKGTRGLIVAPPRTGKTFLIQHVAESIHLNHPECVLFVLLIDERPEEVTDMQRTVKGATIFASSNDRDTNCHTRLAQLVIARAKRLAEQGKDVVILLDSITRLARAFNKGSSTGRTMTGGLDVRALDQPKRLFGQARAFDEGGSLTILGTALIETGSRMDDIIFQEFKGTGNMELVLDRKLADRRTFPAIDLSQSGTRKEERLLPADDLRRITLLRRSLFQLNYIEGMEQLLRQMEKYNDNAAFLSQIDRFIKA